MQMSLAHTFHYFLNSGGDPDIDAQLRKAIDTCSNINELNELLELLLETGCNEDHPVVQQVRRRLARLKLLTVESVLDRIDAIEKKAQADDVASKPDDGLGGPK